MYSDYVQATAALSRCSDSDDASFATASAAAVGHGIQFQADPQRAREGLLLEGTRPPPRQPAGGALNPELRLRDSSCHRDGSTASIMLSGSTVPAVAAAPLAADPVLILLPDGSVRLIDCQLDDPPLTAGMVLQSLPPGHCLASLDALLQPQPAEPLAPTGDTVARPQPQPATGKGSSPHTGAGKASAVPNIVPESLPVQSTGYPEPPSLESSTWRRCPYDGSLSHGCSAGGSGIGSGSALCVSASPRSATPPLLCSHSSLSSAHSSSLLSSAPSTPASGTHGGAHGGVHCGAGLRSDASSVPSTAGSGGGGGSLRACAWACLAPHGVLAPGGAYLVTAARQQPAELPAQAIAASSELPLACGAECRGPPCRRSGSWGGFCQQRSSCATVAATRTASADRHHPHAALLPSPSNGYGISMPSVAVGGKGEGRWSRPRPRPLDLPARRGAVTLAATRSALTGKAEEGLRRKEGETGRRGWLTPPAGIVSGTGVHAGRSRPHQQATEQQQYPHRLPQRGWNGPRSAAPPVSVAAPPPRRSYSAAEASASWQAVSSAVATQWQQQAADRAIRKSTSLPLGHAPAGAARHRVSAGGCGAGCDSGSGSGFGDGSGVGNGSGKGFGSGRGFGSSSASGRNFGSGGGSGSARSDRTCSSKPPVSPPTILFEQSSSQSATDQATADAAATPAAAGLGPAFRAIDCRAVRVENAHRDGLSGRSAPGGRHGSATAPATPSSTAWPAHLKLGSGFLKAFQSPDAQPWRDVDLGMDGWERKGERKSALCEACRGNDKILCSVCLRAMWAEKQKGKVGE